MSLTPPGGHSGSNRVDGRGSNASWPQLTRRRLRLRFVRGAFLGERAHQVHEVPAYFFRRSVAFARHLAFPLADNPEELTVGDLLNRRSVAPVAEVQLHIRGEVAFTVATFAVTHGAIVPKEFAHFR